MKTMIFSDIDGTLLKQDHTMSIKTVKAIQAIINKDIPFILSSARSPSGIYPILNKYDFNCPIVAYSGALILDEHRNILFSEGYSKQYAKEIIDYIEQEKFDLTWNIYSTDQWIVKDRSDQRVIREEQIVEAKSIEGDLSLLNENEEVHKILCMCNPEKILEIEEKLKNQFHDVSITKSSDILIEINNKGMSKAKAIQFLCNHYHIDIKDCIAFGDNFNDEEMLISVGHPYLMANAPEALKKIITNHTKSNEEDGIYYGLLKSGLIREDEVL